MKIYKKNNEILEEKLGKLFKAIYDKDPLQSEITKDVFACLKTQKIKSNLLPHLQKAIEEWMKVRKDSLYELWISELTYWEGNNTNEWYFPRLTSYSRLK